ncbi:hypothetical protein [Methylobacterium nodulans]|uniref:Uncharacterized protein n=1 Tax=Methylobacterium nodulans (strain LMG 21967 / CNCM I-2342 / ORS 2060) TaxID=460265 RepID=B8IK40_METNO|nr:hypothetical protein [Methylobacterium nodulans]ACL60053.1 conserved hypothetical protein [Methylobacterium nodulans ORS 2060]
MRPTRLIGLALMAASLGAAPLAAQTADPGAPLPGPRTNEPTSTGTTTRTITSTGQTKPPGRAAAPREGNQPDRIKEINRRIDTGICIGCN